MNFFVRVRLKIRDFYRRYKNIIIIGLIAWAVVIAINIFLKNFKAPEIPKTTYTPDHAIMDDTKVPQKVQSKVNTIIDEFVKYGNAKDYEKAYNMIEEDCKQLLYPDIEVFKKYINQVFNTKKIYNIQNYSNLNKSYIYNVRILDDILATGITGKDYTYYEEKFVFKDTYDGIKLCIGGFIGKEKMDIVAEDEYMKINIYSKTTSYDTERYTVKITNRTSDTIVLSDGTVNNEIQINIGNQYRNLEIGDEGVIVIYPRQTKDVNLEFTKYADDGRTSTNMMFNSIRILKSYSGEENTKEDELKNATKLYSLKFDLNK